MILTCKSENEYATFTVGSSPCQGRPTSFYQYAAVVFPVREGFDVLTWPIGVALAEGGIGEAHRAVADDDKAWQAGELRVVH